MTLDELIQKFEAEVDEAGRRREGYVAAITAIVDGAKRQNRGALTQIEDDQVTRLIALRDAANIDVAKALAKLGEARKAKDDEDRVEVALASTRRTGVGTTQVTDREFPAGANSHRAGATSGPRWVRTEDRRPATVERSQRFGDHEVVEEQAQGRASADQHVIGQHGGFGQMLRAMSTTSGVALVPTVWLADIVDRARNFSAVIRAGAELIPMDTKIVQIGRITADPTVAFRAEGSTIAASDPTFDNVTLTATIMNCLVVGSLEWFQDANNVDEVVSNAIAQAMATHLDLQCLFGGVTTGAEQTAVGNNMLPSGGYPTPPNPRGVLAALLALAASNVLGAGANGTTQTALSWWREVQQTVFQPQLFNEAPNAILWPAKLAQQYVDAYDSTGQPLAIPANIAELERFVTNQIPSGFTQGTMVTRASDLFVGDWRQLLIGQRLDFTVQTLQERYAELGQVGVLCTWRGDVQLARPRAFAVYRYLQGAV